VQGFFLLLLLFFAFYQFSLPLKTYARMLFLLFQQALIINDCTSAVDDFLVAFDFGDYFFLDSDRG
jgi:hypothetical protein